MKVRHIFRKKGYEYHTIGPEELLKDAVAAMMTHRIGSLLVTEDDELLSIITERDVMRTVHERQGECFRIQVRDVMAPHLVCCRAEDSVDEAMELMFRNETGKRIRHLPVLDGKQLVGVLSIGDVVEALLTETRFENRLLKTYIKHWPEDE